MMRLLLILSVKTTTKSQSCVLFLFYVPSVKIEKLLWNYFLLMVAIFTADIIKISVTTQKGQTPQMLQAKTKN